MISLACSIPRYIYTTRKCQKPLHVLYLLCIHQYILLPLLTNVGQASSPKLERPKVDVGLTEEEWNIFEPRWDAFVIRSDLNPLDCSSQIFQCTGEVLSDMLLKSNPTCLKTYSSGEGFHIVNGNDCYRNWCNLG